MKVKRLVSIALISIMTVGLAACGNNSKESGGTTEDGKTVINFYEHSDSEVIAKAMAEKYMELHNDVEVKVNIVSNDDYDDKIKVMLSGGADVDCFWIRGGAQMRQLANTGALYAMDDLMTKNNIDMSVYGSMGEAFSTGGKTYGLCTSKSCWLLWYNKEMFDAAGEEYPINLTWDEYTELAKRLTKDGVYGGLVPNWTMNIGATAVGEYLTDEDLAKTMDYAKLQEKWYVTDKSHASIEEMSGSFDVNAFFADQSSYMMINGDWTFLLLDDYNPDFTWCAAPLPIFDGAEAESTVGSTSCMCINANSKNAEAAFDFLKFYCYSDDGAKIFAENSSIPAYPSDAALEVYKQKVTVPGVEYVFSAKVGLEQGLEDDYEELNEAFKTELNDALVGGCTLDEAFQNYKDRRSEILNK